MDPSYQYVQPVLAHTLFEFSSRVIQKKGQKTIIISEGSVSRINVFGLVFSTLTARKKASIIQNSWQPLCGLSRVIIFPNIISKFRLK